MTSVTEPVDSPRQQLRERIDFCIPTAVVTWPTPYDRRYGELDAGDRTAIVDAIVAALVEAGWGPTAAHEDQDSGLTGTSPAVVLPRDQSGTPQATARFDGSCDHCGEHPTETLAATGWYDGPLYECAQCLAVRLAAHEACIKRLRAGWRGPYTLSITDWWRGDGTEGDFEREPMTEAEQAVMSRGD